MPRKVKKVKVARGQKQKHGKKFWIILSSIITGCVALITATILLVYFLVIKNDDEYDYFANVSSDATYSWNKAKKSIDEYDHMFIYYYDEALFDPEDSTSDAEVEEKITILYKTIVRYNNEMADSSAYEKINFCLVNTGTTKGKPALSDSKSSVTESCKLKYYYNGQSYSSPFGVTDASSLNVEKSEKTDGVIDFSVDLEVPKEAITFVNQLFNLR
ncbi:MAG: hypothetical protein J6Y42_03750 [Bacilli bacterium]|nr:hypothetical protein [Bacilli bacterium]